MDYMIYILAICISAPLLLMMTLADSKSRFLLGFMIIGICIAVLSSEINTLLRVAMRDVMDFFHITTCVTPLSEEILKAIPILFVAVFITDKREKLFVQAMAIGIGFAIMENTYVLLQNIESVSILWAVIRGFASGLMHSLCTLAVGIGISMVRKKRKLFITGTFALLVVASIYHSMYNMLVQSKYMYIGTLMPILTYIPVVYISIKKKWYLSGKEE